LSGKVSTSANFEPFQWPPSVKFPECTYPLSLVKKLALEQVLHPGARRDSFNGIADLDQYRFTVLLVDLEAVAGGVCD
jgi:hypothetical protein